MTAHTTQSGDDRCWVSVETPLGLPALRAFCADVERLFRLNPCLEIRAWEPLAAGGFRVAWRNHSNALEQTLELCCEHETSDAFSVAYSRGIKRSTRFVVEGTSAGSRLTMTDDYTSLPEEERSRRVGEVDRSLSAWGWALHAHLRREHRWGRNPLWRWTMRRIWLPMTPSARRITTMILLVSAAELALVVAVALVYRVA